MKFKPIAVKPVKIKTGDILGIFASIICLGIAFYLHLQLTFWLVGIPRGGAAGLGLQIITILISIGPYTSTFLYLFPGTFFAMIISKRDSIVYGAIPLAIGYIILCVMNAQIYIPSLYDTSTILGSIAGIMAGKVYLNKLSEQAKQKLLRVLKISAIAILALTCIFFLALKLIYPDVFRLPERIELNTLQEDPAIKYKEYKLKVATLLLPEDYEISNDANGGAALNSDRHGRIFLTASNFDIEEPAYEMQKFYRYSNRLSGILTNLVARHPGVKTKTIKSYEYETAEYNGFIDIMLIDNNNFVIISAYPKKYRIITYNMHFIKQAGLTPVMKKALLSMKWNKNFPDWCENPELLDNVEE